MITIKADEVYKLEVTGADLQLLMAGLGEMPHKFAQSVETKLTKQIEEQVKCQPQ